MKNIFLSVVVVAVLVAAGIGGTFADFSDSEEEVGDKLQAGSMDLKVNGLDDPAVLPFSIGPMTPCKYYDVTKTLMNDGSIDGHLYIHIKNVVCHEEDDHGIHPEPEYVAEMGGKVGQEEVVGLGVLCDMDEHIDVEIIYCGTTVVPPTKLNELECTQLYLGILEKSGVPHDITFIFHLQDDEDLDWPGDIKFAHWPTNRFMGDTVTFDVLYELLQTDYTPPGG